MIVDDGGAVTRTLELEELWVGVEGHATIEVAVEQMVSK